MPADESSALTRRKGSCLCGAVQYEVAGEPFTVRVCHCRNCRKATGAACMTNGFFKDDKIRVLQGEDQLKVYADPKTERGVVLNRYFCSACGSNLFLRSEGHDVRIIALGTLDDEVDWAPRTEMFVEQRRHFVKIEVQEKRKAKL
ncbi:Mss4-like protein [Pholiota molesta]|nr:Mss4-like protein [Pholiota molesta]